MPQSNGTPRHAEGISMLKFSLIVMTTAVNTTYDIKYLLQVTLGEPRHEKTCLRGGGGGDGGGGGGVLTRSDTNQAYRHRR